MNYFNDINLSKNLTNILEKYFVEKDTIGMSPAKVYKLINFGETAYLKYSNKLFENTTYCVGRETKIIKWLNGKIHIPKIIFDEKYNDNYFMVMTEIKGKIIENCGLSPYEYIKYMTKLLLQIQSIDITDCPFDSSIDVRLNELKYLIDNNLADTNIDNWEETTVFSTPDELLTWLCENKPKEDLVFSHGDFCGSNIILNENNIGIIDLGRAGKADKWLDISFCIRDIRNELGKEYVDYFISLIKIEPDWDKINYYILLDELF
jgi:aminoglycoside 3'-phosphotransferase-3